ncbi:hypothetical protein BC829DRAFT_239161 [Chytridium lagenaria]|nr:hypothetical protein BC829DRAFT_239161 [Chytridium lagenaria]
MVSPEPAQEFLTTTSPARPSITFNFCINQAFVNAPIRTAHLELFAVLTATVVISLEIVRLCFPSYQCWSHNYGCLYCPRIMRWYCRRWYYLHVIQLYWMVPWRSSAGCNSAVLCPGTVCCADTNTCDFASNCKTLLPTLTAALPVFTNVPPAILPSVLTCAGLENQRNCLRFWNSIQLL